MPRFSLFALMLFVLWASLTGGLAFAQSLVVTPNCGVPGDTIWVKSGGWPKMFPVLGYGSGLDCAWGGQDTVLAYGPGLTSFVRVYLVPDWAEIGDRPFSLTQCVCLNGDCSECQYTTAQLRYVPFRVVSNIGNPWVVIQETYNGRPGLLITYNSELMFDTTPCSRIRLIQVLRLRGLRNGSYIPLRYDEPDPNDPSGYRFWDGPDRQATVAGEYAVDALGDIPGFIPGGTTREHDPYLNGDFDLADQDTIGLRAWGAMGPAPLDARHAFFRDHPRQSKYGDTLTTIRMEFEVNAFCSDGVNQGEYLGQVLWVWERVKGETATITWTENGRRAKPTAAFLAAVARFNEVRNFNQPQIILPTTGGVPSCPSR